MRRALPLLALLTLAACGPGDLDAPETPADEARHLDEAAAATDINVALTDNGAEADGQGGR